MKTMTNLNKSPILLTLLFSVFICVGCGSETPETKFEKYLPTENVNNAIQLSVPPYLDQIQVSSDDINLELSNHSKDLVRFPIDFGIRLYVYNNQIKDWEEIENETTYSVFGNNMDEDSLKKQTHTESYL